MNNKSSVTQYVSKKFKNLDRMYTSIENAAIMEDISSDEIIMGIKGLQSVFPSIDKFIAPIIRVTHNLQEDIGDLNLKQVKTSEYGLWQTSICDTCQTTNLHTKKDCTYTIMSVPEQDTSTTTIPECYFVIELKKGHTVGIKMDPGLTFMFSGRYLMHRQSINDKGNGKENTFVNFTSYGNERLYHHLKSSIKRVFMG